MYIKLVSQLKTSFSRSTACTHNRNDQIAPAKVQLSDTQTSGNMLPHKNRTVHELGKQCMWPVVHHDNCQWLPSVITLNQNVKDRSTWWNTPISNCHYPRSITVVANSCTILTLCMWIPTCFPPYQDMNHTAACHHKYTRRLWWQKPALQKMCFKDSP